MAKQKKQRYEGVVYSTADDFDYRNTEEIQDQDTLPNEKQRLRVLLDKKARKGKIVTIVDGFVGKEEDLADLAKTLKQKCGVGGSAKDGEILIQGDFKQKIFDMLLQMGFKAKSIG
ncbi:translation initiation factor [Sphingobacterium alkalisoli]|uniref:Translation initiation factor n=1 Tax=Sphingobacterium alkalisoli TaxID=1874115 RepID=A0A4U0GR50_9SPHI|nr:translation initiation factor [Sphingobacterium alkalisoli]TJY61307.1 translation initiation factor [Sphingobacterium alkalisoli]GGH31068.1 translation initiation factor [Sphingobacterium alkalisoli]